MDNARSAKRFGRPITSQIRQHHARNRKSHARAPLRIPDPSGFSGEVEAFNISTSTLARSYYEGVVLNTVTTSVSTKEITLPRGSFWVSAKQKNAGLAFVCLEPENIDIYVSFGIVPVEVANEYPVFKKV
ncbi:hypothetical protein BDU57DRAFT_511369 [Ampelomyces quisqualis]|uniref:Uncharacterized protein n=1 Tax=Ampelomyces quisqualis TaxID=50730 RepID=A0A6A5QVQ4_AMPQU|nr:hypothetical protein BDU57DRAFT_511369 [Ampelomyces quisqualis]